MVNAEPRFSIVIPTRNGSETLPATLRTVLGVDYDDYEVVVCDNSSSDATHRLVKELASPRVRYVRPPHALSMSSNWELAVASAQGQSIIVLGDDDALLSHSLREIERLQSQTGAKVIRWSAAFYLWPTIDLPGQNNYLRLPLRRGLRHCDGRAEIRAVMAFGQCYTSLPMVYNSAVDRAVLDQIRHRAGRLFFSRIPDVLSGISIAYTAGSYLSTDLPMTVAGVSGKSTGLGTLVTPNATGADWHRLNATESFDTDPRIPQTLIFPTVPLAECFLAAKRRLFADDETLTLDRKAMIQHSVWCLRASTADQWSAAMDSLRASLDDLPDQQAWFDTQFGQLEPRLEGPLSLRAGSPGSDGDHLNLDTDRFGVRDVAGAAELCENLLACRGRSLVYDDAPTCAAPGMAANPDSPLALGPAQPKMISYAQNGEDVILKRIFFDQAEGFYIDIGANDPVILSLTKHFSDRGWRGINVEPGIGAFQRLTQHRSRDINLNVGVAAVPGTLTFFQCPWNEALSTFSASQAGEYRAAGQEIRERQVPVRTLNSICEEFVTGTIDFLSIDVEGFERQVLEGFDLRKWRPRVILIEATRPGTSISTNHQWESLILDTGYRCAYCDGLNRFYLRPEDWSLSDRLGVPPNILDHYETYEMVWLRQELEAKHVALHQALDACKALQIQLEEKELVIQDLHQACEALRVQLQGKELVIQQLHQALCR